jgi:exoribonuclease R
MKDKIGNTYNGIISGVSDWGIYVEIEENKCEGMVYIRDIKDDKYFYNSDEQSLIGKNKKNSVQTQNSIISKYTQLLYY